MGFNVSCRSCGRSFVDIDDAMLGKKARCACGTVVRLVRSSPGIEEIEDIELPALPAPTPTQHRSPGQASNSGTESSGRRSPSSGKASRKRQRVSDDPSRAKKASAAGRSRGQKTSQKPQPARAEKRNQTTHAQNPHPIETTHAINPHPVETTHAHEVDQVDHRRPLIDDTFSDLDDILARGADSSPLERPTPPSQSPVAPRAPSQLHAKPQRSATVRQPSSNDRSQAAQVQASADTQQRPSIGPLVGVLGSILACGAGLLLAGLLLIGRFSPLAETVFAPVTEPLYGLSHGAFDSGVVDGSAATMMSATSWSATIVALLLLLGCLALLSRIGTYLLVHLNPIGWVRPINLSTALVICVLAVGMWFSYSLHHEGLVRELESLAPENFGLVEEPENVRTFREAYQREQEQVALSLGLVIGLSLVVAAGSLVSLLLDEKPTAGQAASPIWNQ